MLSFYVRIASSELTTAIAVRDIDYDQFVRLDLSWVKISGNPGVIWQTDRIGNEQLIFR